MKRRSIQWSLPLSFAGIALLATLLLGSLMLIVLSQYYTRQEKQFLESNAENLKTVVVQIVNSDQPQTDKEQMVTSLSFIAEMQIRVLDVNYQVLYDSGVPSAASMVDFITTTIGDAQPSDGVILTMQPADTSAIGIAKATPAVSTSQDGTPLDQIIVGQFYSTKTGTIGNDQDAEAAGVDLPISMVVVRDYGLGYNFDSIGDARSNLFTITDLDSSGKKLELSNGPAYGQEVIRSVMAAWGIAGLLAVILSAAAGWVSSRQVVAPVMSLLRATEVMRQGNLSARAAVPGKGSNREFEELAVSFNSMADRVEQNVATLKSFIADAAHEINTPLTAIQTNLELLKQGWNQEYLQSAITQCERLYVLSDELLDLSRIEAAGQQNSEAEIDLRKCLEEIAEVYASRCEQKDISFHSDLVDAPVIVSGSDSLLRRAVGNILDNSLKFTRTGGSITLSVTVEESAVSIRVADTGIGIPQADLPNLFGRFHRGRNSAHFPGNGLGLAIARACVDTFGGDIQISSVEGSGTTVMICLPTGRLRDY